ncbi:MAG TPA: DsbA family protein, partial [Pseudomonadota bacterium]|nr:DsbA family protein [Pseudomonadota bacterium]
MTNLFAESRADLIPQVALVAFLSVLVTITNAELARASLHNGAVTSEWSVVGEVQLSAAHLGAGTQSDSEKDLVRELLEDPDAPAIGNINGDITVYEFFDYRCPYCKRVAGDVMKLVAEDSGIRVVFKEFPVLGEDSVTAAKAALATHKQGKYGAMHEILMEHRGEFALDTLAELADRAGIDADRMIKDMSSPEIAAQIQRNEVLAMLLGIRGTPGFLIGRFLVPGA